MRGCVEFKAFWANAAGRFGLQGGESQKRASAVSFVAGSSIIQANTFFRYAASSSVGAAAPQSSPHRNSSTLMVACAHEAPGKSFPGHAKFMETRI